MKDSSPPAKRRHYDAAFRAEALRLASESRSTQAAARALNINGRLRYKWQNEVLSLWPLPEARNWTPRRQLNCGSCRLLIGSKRKSSKF
jgi:transposase-like protein